MNTTGVKSKIVIEEHVWQLLGSIVIMDHLETIGELNTTVARIIM